MDISKSPSQTKNFKPLFLIVIVVLIILGIWRVGVNDSSVVLAQDELVIGQVQQGDLDVSVMGYGVLRSSKQTLLTAQSNAIVSEILLRPGAQVSPDSVILKLQDPDLAEQVTAQEMVVTQQRSAVKRLNLANKRELLAEEAVLAGLNSEHQTLVFQRKAQQKLHQQGVLAEVDVKTAQLREEQLATQVALQHKRIAQLKQLHQEDVTIATEQLNQALSQLSRVQHRYQQLTVKAGIQGVLQQLSVNLGQSVRRGAELAQVGSSEDLQALIRIPQSKVDQLQIGQPAMIDTRRERVPATVSRITPQVQNGTVEVELSFTHGVPSSARAELNVMAEIQIQHLENVLYTKRPVNVTSFSTHPIFTYTSSSRAEAKQIQFGEENDQFIQIVSGAKVADQLILSDMSLYRQASAIRIEQ
ncbi:HlyD family secretion protein [Pseudoalteromonas sp. T1lg65]|uniref:HlyD family secretion protein n=1 Tax=Pseudoalteromonas sp. T1lg65 TaxID=2077101 RepID=UPI003F7961CD